VKIKTNFFLSFTIIFALSLTLIIFSTCSKKSFITDSSDQTSPLLFKINFTDASLLDLIHRVVLTVSLPETDTSIQKELTLEHRQISGSIEVPVGENRVFTLEALDSSNTVIYRGDTTATVIGGQKTEVTINLFPAVFLLKLSPIYQEVSQFDSFFVDIKLYNVQDLFGISFRVESDPPVLFGAQVSPGGFLGSDDSTIFFSRVDTLEGYVAVSYTLIQGSASGVSGSGKLARIYFKSLLGEAEGNTLVNLIFNYQTLTFYDPTGEREDWKKRVYIHNAQVLIQ
jgi:hypothetical protein